MEQDENAAVVGNGWRGSGARGSWRWGSRGVSGAMLPEGLGDPRPVDPRRAAASSVPPSVQVLPALLEGGFFSSCRLDETPSVGICVPHKRGRGPSCATQAWLVVSLRVPHKRGRGPVTDTGRPSSASAWGLATISHGLALPAPLCLGSPWCRTCLKHCAKPGRRRKRREGDMVSLP